MAQKVLRYIKRYLIIQLHNGDDMRLLVCGGRDYADKKVVYDILLNIQPTEICQGGATGADFLAKQFAEHWKVPCQEFKADWKKYGKAAGPIRNKQMLEEFDPDMVVAFPGGSGTQNMIKLATEAGKKVLIVK